MLNQLPRARWITATAMAAGLLLTGCASDSPDTAGHLEQTTITVDAFEAIDTAGLFIAQQDGLFAREGLNVKLRLQTLVQPQVDDLIQGKADIISGDYVTFIENQTGGDPDLHGQRPDLRIIAESSFLQPNVLEVVVPPHTPVTSVAALRGKRISILAPRNIGGILVNSLLEANGIPLRDEQFPLVPFPAVGTAFAHGKMDAAFVPEPFVTLLEEGGGVQELADLDEGPTSNFPIQGLATSQSWAQRNPDTLRAFLRAYSEGQLIAATSRSQVERVLETFLHLPPVVASLVSLPAFPQGVDPVRLQRTVSAMLRFGMLSRKFSDLSIKSMIYNG
jgi:NitT/TauT family transport system substrate-binding protein